MPQADEIGPGVLGVGHDSVSPDKAPPQQAIVQRLYRSISRDVRGIVVLREERHDIVARHDRRSADRWRKQVCEELVVDVEQGTGTTGETKRDRMVEKSVRESEFGRGVRLSADDVQVNLWPETLDDLRGVLRDRIRGGEVDLQHRLRPPR